MHGRLHTNLPSGYARYLLYTETINPNHRVKTPETVAIVGDIKFWFFFFASARPKCIPFLHLGEGISHPDFLYVVI